MDTVPDIELRDGARIPQLGFGVFQVPPEQTAQAVARALEAGYRLLDTAALYENEREVGQAVADSGLRREELFITTKVWNDAQGRERTLRSFEASLERLGLEWLDLFLIHWPAPAQDLYVETWRTLLELRDSGRTHSVGVSNFTAEHLERLEAETGELPVVNQIELHPWLQQPELRRFHEEHGIATEAWSPLARGALLEDAAIGAIAERLSRTPAQVVLRWHVQVGNVVIPRSVRHERVQENFALFDFELSDEDVAAIAGLDRGERIGPDPATFG